jgi:hypothetical protein
MIRMTRIRNELNKATSSNSFRRHIKGTDSQVVGIVSERVYVFMAYVLI